MIVFVIWVGCRVKENALVDRPLCDLQTLILVKIALKVRKLGVAGEIGNHNVELLACLYVRCKEDTI